MRPAVKRRLLVLARVGFVVGVLLAAFLAFRGHGGEVAAALSATPPHRVVLAGVLVLVGLGVTSAAWLRVLAAFGHPLPRREGRAVFFIGQLGKYVPGGVWSIGAHAHLAGAHDVPARVTAGTSLVFLGLNIATACLVVGLAGTLGALSPLLVLVGVVALLPGVVNRLAKIVAGPAGTLRLALLDVGLLAVLLVATWACYAGAVVLIAPAAGWALLPLAAGSFALSYAVGVAVVVAPAGVGAREVTLVALLSPSIGVGPAGAVAILTRVLHTAGDLGLALATWLLARRRVHRPLTDHPRWSGVQRRFARRT